jgi:hypothetical protein
MSNIEHFIAINRLEPGDAVLLNKKLFGMLDHFAVYVGRHPHNNVPLFAANYTEGVQLLGPTDVQEFTEKLQPAKIEKFHGSWHQRKEAVKRALSKVGEKSYHLIFNNCEHYKNFVQFNKKYSKQVDNVGKALMIGGGISAIVGAASGNKKALGWGLLAVALGAIAANAADQDDK